MNKFAFIIHPLEIDDVARKFPVARWLPDRLVEGMLHRLPAYKAAEIDGVRSEHAAVQGWFIGCLLTSKQLLGMPVPYVTRKIIQCGRLAEKLGAKIVGLGALTSVVGDAGITIAQNLNIAVTTGNSYTVATAIEGTKEAARMMGIDLKKASVVIVGGAGSIGSVCAQIMAPATNSLTLVGLSEEKLEHVARRVLYETGVVARTTTNLRAALNQADIVIAVSSAVEAIIHPEDLKPGTVVCDVARPRDVSKQVAALRDDVLVIEGGIVEVPGDVNFHLNFGYPPKTSYACMAETMILALEGRMENFTLGRELTVKQVEEISALARKHGFKLAGLRSFERAMHADQIVAVRRRAEQKKATFAAATM